MGSYKKRSEFVQIRVSEREKEMIAELKKLGDFTPSEFFRKELQRKHESVFGKSGVGVWRVATNEGES